jgi:hypothetical protein
MSRLVESPLFSYLTILAIQLRVVWEFWSGRDLSPGATSRYFTVAETWAGSLKNLIFLSPLYTAYYGTILKIVRDPVVATLVHRMIVVFAVTLLVTAVTRRLLPASAAWLVSAWWAVLPVNFDTLNEVQLFSFIPTLVAVLLVASRPTHARRAAALAVFGASTVLVMNDLVFATVFFGLFCLWALASESRGNGGLRTFFLQLEPYVAGAAAAFLVVAFFYTRSTVRLPEAGEVAAQRARVSFCQAYAFGYQQRNPDWPGNPFAGCEELMDAFETGQETRSGGPGFVQALRSNPGAVFDHLQGNAMLLPNGIQLALFNGTSRSQNPDYQPAPVNQALPWVLSVICMLILLGGAWTVVNDRSFWIDWIKRRRWPLSALAAPALGALVVIVQQRPRPGHMFALTLILMILVGFSAFALLRAVGSSHLLGAAVPLVALVALVAAPAPYTDGSRPLQERFDRLEPYAAELGTTASTVPGYREELCRYLSVSNCQIVDYWRVVRPLAEAGGALDVVLDQLEIGLFYADEAVLKDPLAAGVVGGADPRWRPVAGSTGRSALFERVPD